MPSANSYFGNIKDAVTHAFSRGWRLPASHFDAQAVHGPVSRTGFRVRVQDTLPFRYRGILEVDLDICTGCLACERACPIDCIVIAVEKDKQTKPDD